MTDSTTITLARTDLTPPRWAKGLMVAEYEIDNCDSMTDYYATKRTRTVALAWSRHTRDLFPEMRAAAALFEETASLATAPSSAEHREKWSMGAGYYLKAAHRYSTGWAVRKRNPRGWGLPDTFEALPSLLSPPPDAAPINGHGVTVAENPERGGIEIRFAARPSDAVLDRLKAHGWRWSRFSACWYHRASPDTRAWAEAFVAEMSGVSA